MISPSRRIPSIKCMRQRAAAVRGFTVGKAFRQIPVSNSPRARSCAPVSCGNSARLAFTLPTSLATYAVNSVADFCKATSVLRYREPEQTANELRFTQSRRWRRVKLGILYGVGSLATPCPHHEIGPRKRFRGPFLCPKGKPSCLLSALRRIWRAR